MPQLLLAAGPGPHGRRVEAAAAHQGGIRPAACAVHELDGQTAAAAAAFCEADRGALLALLLAGRRRQRRGSGWRAILLWPLLRKGGVLCIPGFQWLWCWQHGELWEDCCRGRRPAAAAVGGGLSGGGEAGRAAVRLVVERCTALNAREQSRASTESARLPKLARQCWLQRRPRCPGAHALTRRWMPAIGQRERSMAQRRRPRAAAAVPLTRHAEGLLS